MTEPETDIKTKPKYEYNSAYCRARYRANKYKIRAKYFDRKQKLLEDKADAFREKLRRINLEQLNT